MKSFSSCNTRNQTKVIWLAIVIFAGSDQPTALAAPEPLDIVQGSACYRFGDEETPARARRTAVAVAQEQALRNYRVFVESSSSVKNYQLEEDVIQTASAGILNDVVIDKEERKEQEICVSLTAKISPVSVQDMIQQRINARTISREVQNALVPEQAAFSLKVWTNKDSNVFVENERLIVFVQSARDAYLKLDYYQADGTVVHLVPNIYHGQAFITGGKTYSFGDDSDNAQYVINGPYGDEVIKAIVGTQPFPLPSESDTARSESRSYLNGLRSKLRGVKVIAATASVSLKTESTSVVEYKKNVPRIDATSRAQP